MTKYTSRPESAPYIQIGWRLKEIRETERRIDDLLKHRTKLFQEISDISSLSGKGPVEFMVEQLRKHGLTEGFLETWFEGPLPWKVRR